jgi:diguanylate cyclase (GGDEF)-like protein
MPERNHRLIIIISLLLLTGFIGTSVTSYLVSSAALSHHITQTELPLTGDNVYSEIQRDLLKPTFIASLMAVDTFLRDWVIQGENDPEKIARYLEEIKIKYNTFSSFFVSDHTKRYYYSKGLLKTVQPDESRDQWYFRVTNLDKDYEINLDPDMANHDTMTIFINHKVYDYDGNYIGATGVGLAIHAVKKLISTYQERYNRTIFFTDKTGNITLYGQHFSKPVQNIFDIRGIAGHRQEIHRGTPQSFEYKKDNKTIYVNTRYIPEFGWYLFVEQFGDKAIEDVRNTLVINLVFSFAITGLILIATNFTIASYQRRLTKMAATDKLTGIYNRRAFDIIMDQTLKDIQRKEAPLSIILFDLDHFKGINDTYGHLAGDNVIQKTVETTADTIRSNDILCRWGGEEFLILLKGCGLGDAMKTAEKIRGAVASHPTIYQEQQIHATISLGVTEYVSGDTRETLLKRVDKALYRAKANGKNRCETDTPPGATAA